MSHRRIARARAWLKARDPAEELLIIGGSLDAANELARVVVQTSGSAFGWHRFTLAQLAAVLAAPTMAARGIVPIGRTDWPGILAIATETATSCSAPTQRLAQLPMLLLDVPIASKAEITLIATLCSSASEMLATVPAADEPTLARLRHGLGLEIEDLDEPRSAGEDGGNDLPGSLARLQRHLFNKDATRAVSSRDDSGARLLGAGRKPRMCGNRSAGALSRTRRCRF